MTRCLLALVAAMTVSACDDGALAPSEIAAHTWRLVSIERNGETTTVSTPDRYTLRLDDAGRASVRSDCNSCGGPYTIDGSTIRVGPLACTRAFCGETSLDSEFSRTLDQADAFSASGDTLIIQSGSARLRFTN